MGYEGKHDEHLAPIVDLLESLNDKLRKATRCFPDARLRCVQDRQDHGHGSHAQRQELERFVQLFVSEIEG
jgi:hypothetical protein